MNKLRHKQSLIDPGCSDWLDAVFKRQFRKTPQDIEIIDEMLSKIELIKKLKEVNKKETYNQFLREIKLEKFDPLQCIVHYGNIGTKFYIIIEGRVLVLKPPSNNAKNLIPLEQLDQKTNEFLKKDFQDWVTLNIFKEGQYFGEIALMFDQPRAATLVSLDDVYVFSVSRDQYKKIIESYQKQQVKDNLEFLQSSAIVRDWDRGAVNVLLYDSQIVDFKWGQHIYNQGDPVDAVYIVKEGEVQISKTVKRVLSAKSLEQMLVKNKRLQQKWDNIILDINKPVREKKEQYLTRNVLVATIGVHESFGDEEVFKKLEKRENTAVCVSQTLKMFKIKKQVSRFLSTLPGYTTKSFVYEEKKKLDKREEFKQRAVQLAYEQQVKKSFPPNSTSFFKIRRPVTNSNDNIDMKSKDTWLKRSDGALEPIFSPRTSLNRTRKNFFITASSSENRLATTAMSAQRKQKSQSGFFGVKVFEASEPASGQKLMHHSSAKSILTIDQVMVSPQVLRNTKYKLPFQAIEQVIKEKYFKNLDRNIFIL